MAPHVLERLNLVAADRKETRSTFAEEVREGLLAEPKTLPCQYFYDEEGSLLFERICDLPEYYVTRTERSILDKAADEIAAHFRRGAAIVELGSGSAAKTRVLMNAFLARQGRLHFIPVDVSGSILEESSLELLNEMPELEITGFVGDYHEGLEFVRDNVEESKLILWLGSSIGNMSREDAAAFLRRVRGTMGPGEGLLVGIDLRKDRHVLERAYDDAQGVTARFNKNILARINREFRGDFNLDRFEHRAVYQEDLGRVEMHLVSRESQTVRIAGLGLEISFRKGESIHTENSHKYSFDEIEALATAAGLRIVQRWVDRRSYFSENLLVK